MALPLFSFFFETLRAVLRISSVLKSREKRVKDTID
jgi:hypothetical protein